MVDGRCEMDACIRYIGQLSETLKKCKDTLRTHVGRRTSMTLSIADAAHREYCDCDSRCLIAAAIQYENLKLLLSWYAFILGKRSDQSINQGTSYKSAVFAAGTEFIFGLSNIVLQLVACGP